MAEYYDAHLGYKFRVVCHPYSRSDMETELHYYPTMEDAQSILDMEDFSGSHIWEYWIEILGKDGEWHEPV